MEALFQKIRGDKVIWAVVILLSLISLLAVFSSTQSLAYRKGAAPSFYLLKHLSVLAVGLIIIFLIHQVNYNRFTRLTVALYVVSIPLLLYTLFFGLTKHGGSRWIPLPGVNLTFQSSDLAKLALFLFLARILSVKQRVIKSFKRGFLPVLVPVLVSCLLIAPANLSTALMLGATCCILFFIGRVSLRHLALMGLVGIAGLFFVYGLSKLTGFGRAETWEQRVKNFVAGNNEPDTRGKDLQVTQAKIAIASGGFFGKGPGRSEAKDRLPEGYSDFIYANIIAEYGLLGGAFLVVLYLLFLWRSILIFKRCPFAFGAFIAVGLSITLVFQAMINMAVNVTLLPVTGLTLPMVSMGGSSIWFTSIAIGMVLSVSRYVDEEVGSAKQNIVPDHFSKPSSAPKRPISERAEMEALTS